MQRQEAQAPAAVNAEAGPTPYSVQPPPPRDMMIFLSYVKMHFSYITSNILQKWSNVLHKHYVSGRIRKYYVTTPEHSLLRRSIPLQPSAGCPPSHPASLPTLPALPPSLALHTTRPTTPPSPPPHSACLPSLTALLSCSATTASRALRRASAVLIHLQRLNVWGASQSATPSNILHTPSNILLQFTPPQNYQYSTNLLQYSMYPIISI